jgi:hypothetical protein
MENLTIRSNNSLCLSPSSLTESGRGFLSNFLCFLAFSQCNEAAMPKVIVGCPLDEFKLAYQLRLQPAAILHLHCRESNAPPPALGFGKIRKRALSDFSCFSFLKNS